MKKKYIVPANDILAYTENVFMDNASPIPQVQNKRGNGTQLTKEENDLDDMWDSESSEYNVWKEDW